MAIFTSLYKLELKNEVYFFGVALYVALGVFRWHVWSINMH